MHFMYRNYNKNLVNYHTHVKNQRTYMYDVRIPKSEVKTKTICDNIYQHLHELFLETVYKSESTEKKTACKIYH